jgi:hypothetical protein
MKLRKRERDFSKLRKSKEIRRMPREEARWRKMK